ncbi:MAG: alpha/beta fold hydrolase [Hyphomicrobiaceae bacterium]
MAAMVTVSSVELEVEERGAGRPLLFLHCGEGLGPERAWLDLLAAHYRVIAPWHPGFGNSALPRWIGTVDDVAYLYLDLARQLGLSDAILVGSSFGGWVAAEMCVRNTNAFSNLVLAAPVGIKVSDRDKRDIADMHSMPRAQFVEQAWADPAIGDTAYNQMSDQELHALVRGREALALYGWKPYMHNPRLKQWLHRIDKPTLMLWGDKDRIVTPAYGEAWVEEIPDARMEVIQDCGHFPVWERPHEFIDKLVVFSET